MSPTQADPARRTQAERRVTTEQRVLDAAVHLVAAGGTRALTLAAVGAEAGYSRGIVNHQFGSRERLLDALVVHLQDAFVPPDPGDVAGLDRLLLLVDAYLLHIDANPSMTSAFLALWGESLGAEPHLRKAFAERDARFRTTVAEAIRTGRRDGSIRGDADPVALAPTVVGLLRGIGVQGLLGPAPAGLEEIRSQLRDLLTRGLGDTITRPPSA